MYIPDWAGGPGDNQEDVQWLDSRMARFFADNDMDGINAKLKKM